MNSIEEVHAIMAMQQPVLGASLCNTSHTLLGAKVLILLSHVDLSVCGDSLQ